MLLLTGFLVSVSEVAGTDVHTLGNVLPVLHADLTKASWRTVRAMHRRASCSRNVPLLLACENPSIDDSERISVRSAHVRVK